eukprot:scaffold1965_cov151-Isochrysis_galbana.AAC.2
MRILTYSDRITDTGYRRIQCAYAQKVGIRLRFRGDGCVCTTVPLPATHHAPELGMEVETRRMVSRRRTAVRGMGAASRIDASFIHASH